MNKPNLVLGNLIFPEGSRWKDGLLYFSDIFSHEVVSLTLEGKRKTVFSLENDFPVGLGWLPNGKMLINSKTQFYLIKSTVAGEPFGTFSDSRSWKMVTYKNDRGKGAECSQFNVVNVLDYTRRARVAPKRLFVSGEPNHHKFMGDVV